MTTTAAAPGKAATKTNRKPSIAEPIKINKRIGSTVYTVSIHFSETSKETFEDKILRLIESEVRNSA